MTAYKNISFDDRDTDHLRYGPGWFLEGSWNASHVRQTGTLASANDLLANVTFTFPMPAVGFYYYGIPRCCGGQYAICIDCDPENPNFIPIDAVNRTDDGQNPPVVLFSVTFDTPAVHEIILTNQNDTRFGHSQITLDRFDLEVVDENAPVENPTPLPTVVPSTTPSTGAAPSAIGAATTSDSNATAAIIAGCIGGVAIIAILFVLFFCLWRRKSRRPPWMEPNNPSPFQYAPRVPSSFTYSSEPGTRQSMLTVSTHTTGRLAPLRGQGHYASPSMSSAGNPFNPTRETDAGRVFASEETNRTLPPEYEQVFSRGPSRGTSHSDWYTSPGPLSTSGSSSDGNYPRRKS